jgi:hypothetical protein
MANIQHRDIPDAQRHEPKGISTASANQLYLSNGSASGSWVAASRMAGTGWAQYSNTTYVSTTALAITSTETLIPFTTAVSEAQLPISLAGTTPSNLLNTSTNTLSFITVGDLHTITLAFESYSTSGSPTFIDMVIYGSSNGTTYTTVLGKKTIPVLKSGAGQEFIETSLFPVTSDMVSHGARIYLSTNATVNIINIGLITARVHRAR